MSVADHIRAIQKHTKRDLVNGCRECANRFRLTSAKRYYAEGAEPWRWDLNQMEKLDCNIYGDLLEEHAVVRHDRRSWQRNW